MTGPATRCVAAVIGHPVAHSLSPRIHNHWLAAAGIDGCYRAIDVPPDRLGEAVAALRADGLQGWNVTVPYKTAILPLMDRLSPAARTMGAVNTVLCKADGTLSGFNTDGIGFLKHLNATVPHWPKDRAALVIGAGGAARAAAAALIDTDIPFLMLANRTEEKARGLAADIGRQRITTVAWDALSSAVTAAGLIVNTTTLGMTGQPPLPLDLSTAQADCVVYDIVYAPLETPLLRDAAARGLAVVDGLGMLVHQAAAAFELWFGAAPVYDDALKSDLHKALA